VWKLEKLGGCLEIGGRGVYIGGLECPLEDCDCVVLCCDIAEVLRTTIDC
jgi:hypothetical protein